MQNYITNTTIVNFNEVEKIYRKRYKIVFFDQKQYRET